MKMDDPKQPTDNVWNPWGDTAGDQPDSQPAPTDQANPPTEPANVPPPPPWPVDVKPPLPTNVPDLSEEAQASGDNTQEESSETAVDAQPQPETNTSDASVADGGVESRVTDLEDRVKKLEEKDVK